MHSLKITIDICSTAGFVAVFFRSSSHFLFSDNNGCLKSQFVYFLFSWIFEEKNIEKKTKLNALHEIIERTKQLEAATVSFVERIENVFKFRVHSNNLWNLGKPLGIA